MITHLLEILNTYQSLLSDLPMWVNIIYFGLMIITLIICINADHDALKTGISSDSNNTLNTAVWIAVILMLPVLGAVLYVIGSMIPYHKLKNRRDERGNFPFHFPFKKNQLKILLIVGLIGMIAEFLTKALESAGISANFSFVVNYGLDPVFLCWIGLILADWKETIFRKSVFLRLISKKSEMFSAPPLLGIPCHQEADVNVTDKKELSEEADIVRSAADLFFNQPVFREEQAIRDKTRFPVRQEWECEFLASGQEWQDKKHWPSGMLPDVMGTQYIGHGITRYLVSSLEENDQIFRQRIYYRAVPRFREWIFRALLLQILVLSLFSERGAEIHVTFAEKILTLFS